MSSRYVVSLSSTGYRCRILTSLSYNAFFENRYSSPIPTNRLRLPLFFARIKTDFSLTLRNSTRIAMVRSLSFRLRTCLTPFFSHRWFPDPQFNVSALPACICILRSVLTFRQHRTRKHIVSIRVSAPVLNTPKSQF
jgi:hypothetical protein